MDCPGRGSERQGRSRGKDAVTEKKGEMEDEKIGTGKISKDGKTKIGKKCYREKRYSIREKRWIIWGF